MSGPAGRYDVVIVGGGMVGASLALALEDTPLRVLSIEAHPAGEPGQPSFDDRTSGLGNGARRVLTTLGVWPQIAAAAAPIRSIHVSDAGHFGFARLEASAHGLDAFGYTVCNRHIGAVLWQQLRARGRVELACPARVREVRLDGPLAAVTIVNEAGAEHQIDAALLVAADGAHSIVRAAAGITASANDYGQVAVVANVRTDRASDGAAYERFGAHGPIALLPAHGGHYTLVWAVEPARAGPLQTCADAQFLQQAQTAFGWRAGRMIAVGPRSTYPLSLQRAEQCTAGRVVLIGNAAQALHPVAAQGFNLGLRDAAVLAEMLAAAPDPGAPELLSEFAERRAADRSGMVAFTDNLVRLFGDPRPSRVFLRNLGLLLFDVSPPAKRALAQISVGFGRGLPRLSRGLPLAPRAP